MDFLPFVNAGLDPKTLSAASTALRDAKEQREGLLRSVYPRFDVTTASVLRRLSLVLFPYTQWEARAQDLPLDLYLGVVGQFAYAVALAARGLLGRGEEGGPGPLSVWRGLLVGLAATGIEILAAGLLLRAARLSVPPLDVCALACYKALPTALLVLASALGPAPFWAGCALLGAGAGVHLARCGIDCIKRAQAETLVPTRVVNLQNWLVLVWALAQPALMCLLAYRW